MATTTINNNSHFPSQNFNNFSREFTMTSPNSNLYPFPPQIFDFNPLQKQKQQQQYQNFGQEMVSFSNNNNNNNIEFSQPFSSLLDKHRREIDLYLHFQGERLKEALQQEKKQQMSFLLNNYHSKSMALLREKEQNLEQTREKTKMLEEILKKEEENIQVWQRIAKEKEGMVIELNNMLFFIKENACNSVPGNGAKNDDVESVCECESINNNPRGNNEGERSHVLEEGEICCKWCHSKELGVVFLPCRHLCCCKECESLLGFCPVCRSIKQGSVEILLS